jgi:hypothetical protein
LIINTAAAFVMLPSTPSSNHLADILPTSHMAAGGVAGLDGAESAPSGQQGRQGQQQQSTSPSVPLQHALPARLALDPSNMLAMRDSFFPPSGAAAPPGTQLVATGVAAAGPGSASGMDVDAGAGAAGPRGVSLPHAWRRSPSPLVTTPGKLLGRRGGRAAAAGLEGDEDMGDVGGYDDIDLGRSAPQPLALGSPLAGTLSAPSPDRSPPGPPLGRAGSTGAPGSSTQDVVASSGYFVDAGLAMGRSFRASWGPGGQLVIPGGW